MRLIYKGKVWVLRFWIFEGLFQSGQTCNVIKRWFHYHLSLVLTVTTRNMIELVVFGYDVERVLGDNRNMPGR